MRKPDQSLRAIQEDRQRAELMFKRAQENVTRSPSQNRKVLSLLSELVEIYRKESFDLPSRRKESA